MFTLTTRNKSKKRPARERGQGLVEYALILSLVAVVVIIALTAVGEALAEVYETVVCELNREEGCGGCISESISVTSTLPGGCAGSNLLITVTSSCAGAEMQIDGFGTVPADGAVSWSSAPICTGGATSIEIWSMHPDGSYKHFTATP